jgi:hypothetical protein
MKGEGVQTAISIAAFTIISLLAMSVLVGFPSEIAQGQPLGGTASEVTRIADKIDQICEGDSTQGSVNVELTDGASIEVEDNTLSLSSATQDPTSEDLEHCSSIEGVGGEIEYGGTFSIEIKEENDNKIAVLTRG